jgi:toxin-antitoxin system PIN domain toxin
MLMLDVNVLVYAFRADAARHTEYRHWLDRLRRGAEPFAVAAMVLSSFLRIVTHPRIFREPDTLADALAFVAELRSGETYTEAAPAVRHWDIFTALCRTANARGNLVADAYLAALAIESGSTWVTTDRDFARFSGLRWRHPLGD